MTVTGITEDRCVSVGVMKHGVMIFGAFGSSLGYGLRKSRRFALISCSAGF